MVWSSTLCFSQSGELSIGVDAAYHLETRTRTLETLNEAVERQSSTDFFGIGIALQKKFADTWGFNTGINYVQRQYNARVYFDHCYFAQPGQLCEDNLTTIDDYGYKTVEIPFGISRYISTGEKWELYLNVTLNTALYFQSFYNSSLKYSTNEIHLFSGSLVQSIGLTRNINEKFKLTLEPFIRVINIQRDDPILILSSERKWTFLNNYGIHLLWLINL